MELKQIIQKLMSKEELSHEDLQHAIDALLIDEKNELQAGAFLTLLRNKPETGLEMSSLVSLLKEKMIKVPTSFRVLDIVGTGGDGAGTVNVSTGSAILAASCGVKIAKHGGRAVSSQAGSADVLEALGVNINLSPEKISQGIEEIGIGFCFAPNFHPALLKLKSLRRKLGVPTTFNLLGPLLNPAEASHFLLGVYEKDLLSVMADTLLKMNVQRSMIVHGNGLDELSCLGKTHVIEIKSGGLEPYVIDPLELGFSISHLSDLKGGNAKENALFLTEAFSGKEGAIADALILNASAALYLYGIFSSIKEALPFVRENLLSGKALKLLNKWVEFSNEQ